ncbi:MAG: DinB family protein [Chloroflexi bacterium]|nr:DinB family protein [Chloroflexota bacterium]
MTHALVTQLWFARSEFARCLEGVTPDDAIRTIDPMNSLSWIVGHLASQEHYLWVELAQGKIIAQGLREAVGFGSPASIPNWDEMLQIWGDVTNAADEYLSSLNDDGVRTHLLRQGKALREDIGKSLLRNIFHYWFHLGEAHAIRQQLGHADLPQFVGNMAEVRF